MCIKKKCVFSHLPGVTTSKFPVLPDFFPVLRGAHLSTEVDVLSADGSAACLFHLVQAGCNYHTLVRGPVAVACAVCSACLVSGDLWVSEARAVVTLFYFPDEETEVQTS